MDIIFENYLSLIMLVIFPLIIAGIILLPIFPNHEIKIRRFSKIAALIHFIYTLLFLAFFDPSSYGISYLENLKILKSDWLETLGISMSFGVDGLSLIFIILTSFIFLISFMTSKHSINTKQKIYYSLMFILEFSILGIFTSRDAFLFFMFWELELIPIYFLISMWGSGNAKRAAMKFLMYTFIGSVFILFSILILTYYNFKISGNLTANIEMLNISEHIYPIWFQVLVFLGFFIGFAIKIPIVPFHSWLKDAHVNAATPVSIILAAILLKTGVYGLIRFNIQILPEIFKLITPLILVLGTINLIYASSIAYVQNDIKKIIAYSSIANMGIILIGLSTLTEYGIKGAIFHMVSHAFIVSSLFTIVGIIYLRTKTRDIKLLGGLQQNMPVLAFLSIPICLSAISIPFFTNFIGELFILLGLSNSELGCNNILLTSKILFLISLVLSAAYILRFYHKTFLNYIMEQFKSIKDITISEFVVLSTLICTIIFFGIYPSSLISIFETVSIIILDTLQV